MSTTAELGDGAGRTVADLLAAGLDALGVQRVYGQAVPGLAVVPVTEPALADLLADVDGHLGRLGASFHDGVLRLSSRPGAVPEPREVTDAAGLAAALATPVGQAVPDAFALRLDVDLDGPAGGAEPLSATPEVQGVRLSPDLAADLAVVVGPGVVRAGAVGDLRRFAEASGLAIVNTWGAKGVLTWDSPHHAGTAGLQARDLDLAGVTGRAFVATVGLDPDEVPATGLGGQRVDLHPAHLPLAAVGWPAPTGDPPRPPLYTELAAVVGPAYDSASVPLHPARATRDLGSLRPDGGVVVADPGPAGLWVARTFPTVEPGTVLVPATRTSGSAAAAALVGGSSGRPVLAVTTFPLDPVTEAVLDLARALAVPVTLEAWGGEADLGSPEERIEVTAGALARPGVDVVPVPVDLARTADLVEVAGEVVAWTT